jgi:hypothetical protein
VLTDEWWNFFYLRGSSATTLSGLTFVAVTVGSTLIKKDNLDEIDTLLSPICFHLFDCLFFSAA